MNRQKELSDILLYVSYLAHSVPSPLFITFRKDLSFKHVSAQDADRADKIINVDRFKLLIIYRIPILSIQVL